MMVGTHDGVAMGVKRCELRHELRGGAKGALANEALRISATREVIGL